LTTQSQTKIYRSTAGQPARQSLTARVAEGAFLVSMPDAVSCFADSVFEQRQRLELCSSSSLMWLEWLTSGRRARGERWAFRRYHSTTDVLVANKLIFRDTLRLDQTDGPVDNPHRMGKCDCFATILLLGPRLSSFGSELLKWIANQPMASPDPVMFAASPVADGVVVRVAGPSTELVGRWLRAKLNFLPELLGGNPWERKW
jgi:urease accessory protein